MPWVGSRSTTGYGRFWFPVTLCRQYCDRRLDCYLVFNVTGRRAAASIRETQWFWRSEPWTDCCNYHTRDFGCGRQRHRAVKDIAGLAELYAVGVVGAIATNLGAKSTDNKLNLARWERALMFCTFLVMAAIEISLLIEKPGVRVFAGKRGGCRSSSTRDFSRQETYAPRRAEA